MSIAGITYFNYAGPNDFVALTRSGSEVATGNGLAGFLRPSTSVSVVPLGVKTVNFQVVERSKDRQQIMVTGELVVTYVPEMRKYFDFSVFRENGQYRNEPTAQIEDQIKIAVRGPIRNALAEMDLEGVAGGGVAALEAVLNSEVTNQDSVLMKRLQANAIAVQSASIKTALPADRETAAALGAKEREVLLASQDKAVAERRQSAAESDRSIRAYEEATELELTQERTKRVEAEGQNRVAEAEAEAEAMQKKLALFADMEPGKVLAQAILKAAENGIDRLSVDPALTAAIRSANDA